MRVAGRDAAKAVRVSGAAGERASDHRAQAAPKEHR